MANQSPKWDLNEKEIKKSNRDVIVIAISSSVLELANLISGMDFGEYTWLAHIVASAVGVFINRLSNTLRIK